MDFCLQIVRINQGNTNVPADVVASAQVHMRDRGLVDTNYVIPIGYRTQIKKIFELLSKRAPRNRQVISERMNNFTRVLRNYVARKVPESIRADWPQINVVHRNDEFLVSCPSCSESISVYDRNGNYFKSWNFCNHLMRHIPMDQRPNPAMTQRTRRNNRA